MTERKAHSSRFTLVLPPGVRTIRLFNQFHVIICFGMCIQGVSRDSGVFLFHADIYIPCQCYLFEALTCGLYVGCLSAWLHAKCRNLCALYLSKTLLNLVCNLDQSHDFREQNVCPFATTSSP